MGLRDLLGGFWSVLDYVHLDQFPEAVAALSRLPGIVKDTDYGSDAEVGALVDAVLYAGRQAVEVTKTPVDDRVMTAIGELATAQRDFIIAAVKWFASNPEKSESEFIAAMNDSAVAASTEAVSVTTLIEIALLIIELWRKWKN